MPIAINPGSPRQKKNALDYIFQGIGAANDLTAMYRRLVPSEAETQQQALETGLKTSQSEKAKLDLEDAQRIGRNEFRPGELVKNNLIPAKPGEKEAFNVTLLLPEGPKPDYLVKPGRFEDPLAATVKGLTAENTRGQIDERKRKAQEEATARTNELAALELPGIGRAKKDSFKAVIDKRDSIGAINGDLNTLIGFADKPASRFSMEDRARANVSATSLIGALRAELTGPGSMSEGDRKLLESVINDPTALLSNPITTKATLSGLRDRVNDNFKNFLVGRVENFDPKKLDFSKAFPALKQPANPLNDAKDEDLDRMLMERGIDPKTGAPIKTVTK